MSDTDVAQKPKRGRGRPPKGEGPRTEIRLRMPTSDVDAVKQGAAELGLPVSDYVALSLCKTRGLPVPDYIEQAMARHAALSQERMAS